MLQPLKLYRSRNEIFIDLDLTDNEMNALTDLFEDHGEIQYNQEEKHVYTKKPSKSAQTFRDEERLYWINFVIWTYIVNVSKTTSHTM